MILVYFPIGKTSGNLFNPRINVPIREKSGNLFNDPGINVPSQKSLEIYLIIFVSICPYKKKSGNLFYYSGINVSMRKNSVNLFNNPRIAVPILKKSGN